MERRNKLNLAIAVVVAGLAYVMVSTGRVGMVAAILLLVFAAILRRHAARWPFKKSGSPAKEAAEAGVKYELEVGEYVTNLICECCNQPVKRVWGFVSKDGAAHAVYYALLVEHGDDRWVGITLSIGRWWEDDAAAVASRQWCHLRAWYEDNSAPLRVEEPTASNFYPWESGGRALTRAEVLASEVREEFYAVADFINIEDPAVNSFLLGKPVNIRGRGCKHGDKVEFGDQPRLN